MSAWSAGFSSPFHLFLKELCMCQGGGSPLQRVASRKGVVRTKVQSTVNKRDLLLDLLFVHQSPACHAHSSTQQINQRHYHDWWKLQCCWGHRKLIKPSGQRPCLQGRLLAAAFTPALSICHYSALTALIVMSIDRLSFCWMRKHTLGTGAVSCLNMQHH